MTVTDGAYISVLENKLIQAERSLHEFKSIFQHWTKTIPEEHNEYITAPEEDCTD
ncbi:unnamed protein product [marine sediment metagenome]|uniref:Uncharacterized protein n=1 Tax=marine sediment metagenome TaxID=412755 RepID=X0XKL9_9ZZZZ